ncbi:hypothetical protein [Streptosporangium amethystogenes]|uniref:hypothetical protein n=1 Tax=Streptosporangium amethystogenes TaxID=2002 RepID=UPI0012F9DBF2|nr:hypothetical protein [Streptosporangium amethystogenes]
MVAGWGNRVFSHNDVITALTLLELYAEDRDLTDPLVLALKTELGMHDLNP